MSKRDDRGETRLAQAALEERDLGSMHASFTGKLFLRETVLDAHRLEITSELRTSLHAADRFCPQTERLQTKHHGSDI